MEKLSSGEVLSMIKFGAAAVFAGGNREPTDQELAAIIDRSRTAAPARHRAAFFTAHEHARMAALAKVLEAVPFYRRGDPRHRLGNTTDDGGRSYNDGNASAGNHTKDLTHKHI